MIIIIQEKDRALVEERFGSIIKYKQFIYKNSLYGLGITDYGALLKLLDSFSYALCEALDPIVEAFKELGRTLVSVMGPVMDSLSDIIELIQPESSNKEYYMHPPEIHPPVMKIGKENTLPHVPKQKIHRNRNNC